MNWQAHTHTHTHTEKDADAQRTSETGARIGGTNKVTDSFT